MEKVIKLQKIENNCGNPVNEPQCSNSAIFVEILTIPLSGQIQETTGKAFGSAKQLQPFIEVNEISDDLAKSQIRELLDKNPRLDSCDIAERLNLDIRQVWKLCDELVVEKKIRPIDL